MAALKRDSTLSTTSSGSEETLELRNIKDEDSTGREKDCYTVDYENIETLLRGQINSTEENRGKIKRLKSNLCLLIVFLVNNLSYK